MRVDGVTTSRFLLFGADYYGNRLSEIALYEDKSTVLVIEA